MLLNGVNYICSFLVISSYAEVICVFTSDFEESGKHMFSDPKKSSRSCKAIRLFLEGKALTQLFFSLSGKSRQRAGLTLQRHNWL